MYKQFIYIVYPYFYFVIFGNFSMKVAYFKRKDILYFGEINPLFAADVANALPFYLYFDSFYSFSYRVYILYLALLTFTMFFNFYYVFRNILST